MAMLAEDQTKVYTESCFLVTAVLNDVSGTAEHVVIQDRIGAIPADEEISRSCQGLMFISCDRHDHTRKTTFVTDCHGRLLHPFDQRVFHFTLFDLAITISAIRR